MPRRSVIRVIEVEFSGDSTGVLERYAERYGMTLKMEEMSSRWMDIGSDNPRYVVTYINPRVNFMSIENPSSEDALSVEKPNS